jgi:hypothetical protein
MVKMQERRRLEHNGGEVRRTFAPAIQDQKLVPYENGLGDYAPESSWLNQTDDCDDQVKQKNQETAHLGNPTKSTKPLISRPIWNSPEAA